MNFLNSGDYGLCLLPCRTSEKAVKQWVERYGAKPQKISLRLPDEIDKGEPMGHDEFLEVMDERPRNTTTQVWYCIEKGNEQARREASWMLVVFGFPPDKDTTRQREKLIAAGYEF